MSHGQHGVLPTERSNRSRAIESVRVCGTCYELYEDRASGGRSSAQRCSCRKVADEPVWAGYDFNEWVRLCDCCGLVALKSGSRYSMWFCPACRKEVEAYHQAVGRRVVPVGRHSFVNGTSVPFGQSGGDKEDWVDATVRGIQGLDRGIELLKQAKHHRMRWNLLNLELRERESIGLVEYLEAGEDLLESHADEISDAMDDLVGVFAVALIDPVKHPPADLEDRIEEAARTHVASLPAEEIQKALAEGPNAVYRLGFEWAFLDGARLIYPEACRTGSHIVMIKLAPVVNALSEAVAERVRLVWGAPAEPRLPVRRNDLGIWTRSEFSGDRSRISPHARYVFSTETNGCGTSSQQIYYLTRSADQREWMLWCCIDHECTGRDVYCPVAGCRRKGVSMEDAACLLMEALLETMRDAWEEDAPTIGGTGLITSDQAWAIVERLWPDA